MSAPQVPEKNNFLSSLCHTLVQSIIHPNCQAPYICFTCIRLNLFYFCLPEKMLLLKFTKGKSYITVYSISWMCSALWPLFSQLYVAPFCRVSTRYGQQAELKEQNQHLMATNEELQKNLTDTQVQKAILMKYS